MTLGAERESFGLAPLASLAYELGAPAASAIIKQAFADFRVDEQLGFEPNGEGEHVFLHVRKTDASTVEVAKRIGVVAAVAQADVGYSGMKDRRGETSQWFSVKLPSEQEGRLAALEDERVSILSTHRNSRKLKIGSHARNRFELRLRGCRGEPAEFERRLQAIRDRGVPNYFGAQRFGAQMSNLQQVSALLRGVLAGQGGADARRLPRFKRGILFSAARSYLFNQLLSARVGDGTWSRYVEGDVLGLDGSGRCFALGVDEAWDEELQRRLESMDIHITGPLPGRVLAKDRYTPRARAADIEEVALADSAWLVDGLRAYGLDSARRPLRFRAQELTWRWEPESEVGVSASPSRASGAGCVEPDLILEFFLPRGAYATSLLRELCQLRES